MNTTPTISIDANLVKKYHQDLVFNYSEYPTKDHWNFSFGSKDFKDAIKGWFPNNMDKKIFFYVHIPFCEELCWFCTCSKTITGDYSRVKSYLEVLHEEIDLLFAYLQQNNIFLNVDTVFFGGGSPTILQKDDLVDLVQKLRKLFDWANVKFFTIETDPRRVDEERLIFNSEICGANRISFGMQDLDPDVQRRVNRIQPIELFERILTDKVRSLYKEIAVDLLIGQPGQTLESMGKTCDAMITRIRPTLVQLSLMAYKPWVAKYQVKMLDEGPLPDFYERKALLEVVNVKLKEAGYIRTGFECYSLPESPMTKAFSGGDAHYGAAGHQPSGLVNFIAVGSSSMSNLGDEYYAQNFYDIDSYSKAIAKKEFATFRGMKLSDDDRLRQFVTQKIRSYFQIDFAELKQRYQINALEYFKSEIEHLREHEKDGLLLISETSITLTEFGRDFVQNIMNVFDKYDPPNKTLKERLVVVHQAKEAQRKVQSGMDT